MRKRSQAPTDVLQVAGSAPGGVVAIDTPVMTTPLGPAPTNVPRAYCSVCGLPQRDPFNSGILSCANQHESPSVDKVEGEAIQKRLLDQHAKEFYEKNGHHPPPKDEKSIEKVIEEVNKVLDAFAAAIVADVTPLTVATPGSSLSMDPTGNITATSGDSKKIDNIEKLSEQLKESLDKPDPTRRATDWDNANKGKETDLDPAFMSIVKSLVIDDPTTAYATLENALVVGNSRGDYGSVMKHLDEAEGHARFAHRLWQSSIIEQKRWELDNAVVFSAMWEEANKALQHEKDQKNRSKMITDADVESRVAILFPDEYRRQEIKRLKAKSMVASLQNLCEVWMSRCKTLQVILSKQR